MGSDFSKDRAASLNDDSANRQDECIDEDSQKSECNWKILIVDDDQDVHEATDFILSKVRILDRPLKLYHAVTAEEALRYLQVLPDIAVILLDVVMEAPDSGLRLVKEIRSLGFKEPRIILRTGYPGLAPESRVIQDYEVDDYWSKDELTRSRLFTSLTTAIRSYDYIHALNATRAGLEMVIDATQTLFESKDLDLFSEGVLRQIAAIMRLRPEGAICALGSSKANPENMVVMSGVGRFASHVGECIAELEGVDYDLIKACEAKHNELIVTGTKIGLRYRSGTGREMLVYFEHQGNLDESNLVLLHVFCNNLSICFENLALINQLGELAFQDQRLGVPNQNAFDHELFALTAADAEHAVVAMISIEDAPNLAVAFGLSMAEALMVSVYERLNTSTDDAVMVARVSEFTFGVSDRSGKLQTATLEKVFDEPFSVMDNRLMVSASIGVVRGNLQGWKGADIQRAARITLLKQEQNSPGGTSEFRPEMADEVQNATRLKGALQNALKAKNIYFVFQPKINLNTGKVISCEALCRWHHEGEAISPCVFIPIAERAGLSADIAFQCLDGILELRRILRDKGYDPIRVAVNLAAADLCNVEFVKELIRQCQSRGLDKSAISFEITESQAFTSDDAATAGIHMLADNEYKIWLDDFGTGYSSLSHLNLLPVSGIKIDQSFVKNLTIETARGSVAASAAAIAENLGLKAVAEGVETREQQQIARFLGIDVVQGFFYSPGLTAQEFISWYEGWDLAEKLKNN